MIINTGYVVNKMIKLFHRPALRTCIIDKTSKVGSASNCIRVQMGRYSYMGSYNSVCDAKIGSFCSIASHCSIGGGNHPIDHFSTSPVFCEGRNCLRKNFAKIPANKNIGVVISDDVWIGEGVFIVDGVKVGTGAVVRAHAVVTKDIPPYAIAVGVPARVIRYRFDNETIEKLINSKWWECADDCLAKIESVSSFLESIDMMNRER